VRRNWSTDGIALWAEGIVPLTHPVGHQDRRYILLDTFFGHRVRLFWDAPYHEY
jgi:hypothetical protein